MAYVIAVCGAGGKTTKCDELAYRYIDEKKKTCVLTTTHMWLDKNLDNINTLSDISNKKVYYFGEIDGEKIGKVSDADYKKICKAFDYVIVEADGSRMMPLKVPKYIKKNRKIEYVEPVIPKNADEIIIMMGLESLGREIGVVCQHFENIKDTYKLVASRRKKSANIISLKKIDSKYIVDENLIDEIIDYYYTKPLSEKFKKSKITITKTNFANSKNYENIKSVALVLCAAGFSRRFGDDNKLLTRIEVGKNAAAPLYKVMASKLVDAKNMLIDKFDSELSYNKLSVDLAVVSQYDSILKDEDLNNNFVMLHNDHADDGLSSSIKIAMSYYKNYDAIMFLNSDMPKLPVDEITLFLFNSICSNNKISSMYTDGPKNPAYFESIYFDEIMKIDGDVGPKHLLDKYKMETYKYYIDAGYLFDIDTTDDLKML